MAINAIKRRAGFLESGLNTIGAAAPIAGAAIGSIVPGVGTAAGFAAGTAVGGVAKLGAGAMGSAREGENPYVESKANGGDDAMARKMVAIQNDSLNQLRDAKLAVAHAPKDIQDEYGGVIESAYELEMKRRRGMA